MLKSDNWIRQMCEEPTHIYSKENGVIDYISKPFSLHQNAVFNKTNSKDQLNSISFIDRIDSDLTETIRSLTNDDFVRNKSMITPFFNESIKHLNGNKSISYGVSSYGYDVRLSNSLKIFTNINSMIIDPYELNEGCYVDAEILVDDKGREYAILPPNSFLLGHTIEYFNIPVDVLVIAVGKSTWARAGVSVIITPIEPGFSGEVVIEIANQTTLPIKIYTGVGISQFVFFQSDERCLTSYQDRSGKYQGQTGVTLGKV